MELKSITRIENAIRLGRPGMFRFGVALTFFIMLVIGMVSGEISQSYLLLAAAMIAACMAMNIGANNAGPAINHWRRLAVLCCLLVAQQASAELMPRQHIHVVGSSTAYPIVASAAEYFGHNYPFATPVVESTGTGGGIKLFCAGLGLDTPDVAMASRRMKVGERNDCEKNGVTDIREIKIGFDGIVFASNRKAPELTLTRRDIYLALARWVPSPERPGTLMVNPYRNWKEVDSHLPDLPIHIYGPPPTSGTRDILVDRLLTGACMDEPGMRELFEQEPRSVNQQCKTLREDGLFVNAGENDSRLVRKLINDPQAFGIFGFNFLDRNRDHLQAASIDGTSPEFETIESGRYPLSRPLYLYIKQAHQRVAAGLDDFVDSITREEAIGAEGRLIDKGLIPLTEQEAH